MAPTGANLAPDGASFMVDDDKDDDEIKPWDKFFQKPAPEIDPDDVPKEWSLLHEGRSLGDGLIASSAELVSDLLWGNLALPIDKCLEKLRRIDALYAGAEPDLEYIEEMSTRIDTGIAKEVTDAPQSKLGESGHQEDLLLRRECREMLELSTQQLEEMQEKKGEFGNEYRVVRARPHARVRTPRPRAPAARAVRRTRRVARASARTAPRPTPRLRAPALA